MPEAIDYDPVGERLLVGEGYVERMSPAVWNYEVSGKHVLRQWFSYRQKDRFRPSSASARRRSRAKYSPTFLVLAMLSRDHGLQLL